MLNGVNVTKTRENSKENHDALCAKISEVLDYLTDSERGRKICHGLMKILGPRILDQDPFEKKLVSPDADLTKDEMAMFESIQREFLLVKTLMKVIQTLMHMYQGKLPFKNGVLYAEAKIGAMHNRGVYLVTRTLCRMIVEMDGYVWMSRNANRFVTREMAAAEWAITSNFWWMGCSEGDAHHVSILSFLPPDMDKNEMIADGFVAFVQQHAGVSYVSLQKELEEATQEMECPPMVADKAPEEVLA